MPRFRLFFTPAGLIILVIALVILIRSLLARNAYEIMISSGALLFLLVIAVIGFWKSKKLKTLEAGWKPPFPSVANADEETMITGLGEKVPLFFRLHFIVRGHFYPCAVPSGGNRRSAVLAETSVSRGEAAARLSLDFPMSGVFRGDGFCRLKDIFGFYSFSCGIPQDRIINVRSSPCFGKDYHVNAQSGAEDKRNKTSSDEERYYMREYTPGDRFRDINWKSSEKIDALITRISPDNQEKVSRIEVILRNYCPAKQPSLEALWLLDRAKARLSHFLRSLMEQQASFIFHVRTASGSWEIEDEEDLDAFLEELAGVSFSFDNLQSMENLLPSQELYVFSTACDAGLPSFILACHPRPVSLFLVQPLSDNRKGFSRFASTREKPAERKSVLGEKPLPAAGTVPKKETETLKKRDFPAKGCFPYNVRWFFGGGVKQLGVQANKVEIIYAETKL